MHLIIDIHPAAMFSFQVYLLDYWQQLSALRHVDMVKIIR